MKHLKKGREHLINIQKDSGVADGNIRNCEAT